MSQAIRYYDFNLSANGSQVILASGSYFRIQAAAGAIDVNVEGVGTLPQLVQGQGMQDTPFQRLVIRDVSGQVNSGSILIAAQEFIDNRSSNSQGPFVHGAFTIGNTSSQISAAKAARRYVLIQNKDATGNIWVTLNNTAATTTNGILIAAGGSLELNNYAPTGSINAIGNIASNPNVLIVEG